MLHQPNCFLFFSPTVRRLWRRMSEPVNDLPADKKLHLPRVHTHPKNLLLQKVEVLQSFTEEAINVLRQDIEATKSEVQSKADVGKQQESSSNIAELLKALDETHQQFRNKLLKTVYQNKRQTSTNREETEIIAPDTASPDVMESPRDVKKFLFKLEDLSGSLVSLDTNEDHPGVPGKPVFRAVDPPGSPLPEILHPHELEIIEEQNEADNEENQESPAPDPTPVPTPTTTPAPATTTTPATTLAQASTDQTEAPKDPDTCEEKQTQKE